MVPPLLKLEFSQGPRAGESLEFKPGSSIGVGRIVRGNKIAIKDAGISTKHLRIVSDSENWIIHDSGSSNGTILNTDTIDPDTPVNLSHGDEIKLGEDTSIVVNFVSDVQAPQEHKLPPRPRRNNKRLAVPVPDPDPIESVQEKPKRTRRSSKQEENELPKGTTASRKKTLDDIADEEEELEVEIEKNIKSRVGRPRKIAITKEEEVVVEKKVNSRVGRPRKVTITKEEEVVDEGVGDSRVRRGKNTESVQNLGLKPIKLEVEDTPKGVEVSEVKNRKRATRSKQIENACLGLENVKREDTVLEEKVEKRATRATRSKKTEIGGDSFLELEMVLSLARKSRAKRRKVEQEPSKSVVEMEDINDDAGEEVLKNCHGEENEENEVQGGGSERSEDKCDKEDVREGDGSKRVEQVAIGLMNKCILGEDDLSCTVREDEEETENEQDIEDDKDNEAQEGCSERSDDKCDREDEREGDGSKRVEQVEIEIRKKSSLGEDGLNCTVRDDGETENLQEIEEECHAEESECKVEEAGIATLDDGCDEEKVEQGWSSKNVERVEVDLGKMKLREWFASIEVQLPKQIIEETEKMIEPMRSKTLRVQKHISEQREKVV